MLDRWYEAVGDAAPAASVPDTVLEPLLDDLNTPAALGALHRLADPAALKAAANLMGLLRRSRSERASRRRWRNRASTPPRSRP